MKRSFSVPSSFCFCFRPLFSARPIYFFPLLVLCTLFLIGRGSVQAAPIQTIDIDQHPLLLNAPGYVTVVLSSSSQIQRQTRDASHTLDSFQGRPGFRQIVVVDLSDSLAGMVSGYVGRRMRSGLDIEAERIRPFYRTNGNPNNPRPDVRAIADFDGKVVKQLGWNATPQILQAVIFDQTGHEVGHWNDLRDYSPLSQIVARKLSPTAIPSPAAASIPK